MQHNQCQRWVTVTQSIGKWAVIDEKPHTATHREYALCFLLDTPPENRALTLTQGLTYSGVSKCLTLHESTVVYRMSELS